MKKDRTELCSPCGCDSLLAATPFALLEDKGGNRIKIGYVTEGGWTGAGLDGTGWADKDEKGPHRVVQSLRM